MLENGITATPFANSASIFALFKVGVLEFTELTFTETRKHYLSAARGLKGEDHEYETGKRSERHC